MAPVSETAMLNEYEVQVDFEKYDFKGIPFGLRNAEFLKRISKKKINNNNSTDN